MSSLGEKPLPKRHIRSLRPEDIENPHPLYVVWEITLKCDLGCKHCGSRAGKARPRELTTAECFEVVRQIAELGVREVTVIGGEAYLRADWPEIVAEITRSGMGASMTTGARNLTQQRVDQARAAGMKSISISLDGLEATHDAQRGSKGSWQAAVDAGKRVVDAGIRLATNTQINRLSMPEIPAVADTMREIGSTAWQVQLTVAMGRAADRPELLLQPYDLLELFPLLVWVKENQLDPHGISLHPGNNIGYFGPYEELLRYGGDFGAHWQGCVAGKWSLGIEADGRVKGCPSLATNEYSGGNILKTPLRELTYDAPEINHIKSRTREDLWGFCKTCYYGDTCLGGCTWTSHSLLSRAGNNPYCIHRALELEREGKRERVVKVEDAPGLPFDHGRFEIIEEIWPEASTEPTILGVDVAKVLEMRSRDRGVWTPAEIRDRLTRR